MKKVLFTLFALMAFLPLFAADLGQTDAPVISGNYGDRNVIIYVTGDGLLNVNVTVDGELVEAVATWWEYEFAFDFDATDHVIEVSATAQADGWSVSDVASETFYVDAGPKPLEPIISFYEPGDGVDIMISGQTDEAYLVISIAINGVPIIQENGYYGVFSYHVGVEFYNEQHITVEAYAVHSGTGVTSDHATGEYVLAGIPYPLLPQPVIQIEENNDYVTICATGDDYAYPRLLINGQEVNNYYDYYRGNEEAHLSIDAIVEAPGWESNSAHMDYVVAPKPLCPVMNFDNSGNGVDIIVCGQTDDVRLMVTVTVNGELLFESESDAEFTCHIDAAFNEDKIIMVDAVAVNSAGIKSDHNISHFMLLGIPYPTLPQPIIEIVESDDDVTIYATGDDSGFLTLLVNNAVVENPYVCSRGSEEVFLSIDAIIEAPGWEPNCAHVDYIVAPKPVPPVLKTVAPTFSGGQIEETYTVNIVQSEPSTIYYRWAQISDENDEWEFFPEFGVYEDELSFEGPGYYRIEAYAVADGKLASDTVAYEFEVYVYGFCDFYEDGIFYKITGEGKVSVCCPVSDYDRYKGDVTIPAYVTHDGVTYMVTGIYRLAFAGCSELTGVTIGPYVTTIGEKAFSYCEELGSVTLGDYVISVGDKAFNECKTLSSVTLGSGLKSIGSSAFERCPALKSVTCKAATPPTTEPNSFGSIPKDTLYVYPAVLESYQASPYWTMFRSIVGDDKVVPVNGDVNGDGSLSISDITTLISRLLKGE